MAAALAMRVVPASATRTTIKGTVFHSEQLRLSLRSRLTVRLLDVTLGDQEAETVAETEMPGDLRNPMPYWITFDSSRLAPTKKFVLDARVTAGNISILSTPSPTRFCGDGTDRTDLTVEAPRGAFDPPYGHWLVEEIGGGGVIDRVRSILIIEAGGRMVGKTGCNTINGHARIEGCDLRFGGISTTAKLCGDDISSQEGKFDRAVKSTSHFLRLPDDKKLLLLDYNWRPLMRLAEI